ncbi:MAG: thrombospondin type 3 repeat-containing protein [Kofleriaceae bacterium]|nr:thrombospondin type 3 repeat-containing protein [Kofleriaceae bacterium]
MRPTPGSGLAPSVLVLVLVGGCAGWLGLDEAVTDRDLDGVVDVDDNCPDQANPDQADRDGDGRGDACLEGCATPWGVDLDGDAVDDGCDPCVGTGPVGGDEDGDGLVLGCDPCPTGGGVDLDQDHLEDACEPSTTIVDEDGDLVDDADDNCPGRANPDQLALIDLDAIGDACDPDDGTNLQVLFEPFAQLPAGWVLRNAVVQDGALELGGPLTSARSDRAAAVPTASSWTEVPVALPAGTGETPYVEIVLRSRNSTRSMACRLDHAGTLTLVHSAPEAGPVVSTPTGWTAPGELPLRIRTQPVVLSTDTNIWCEVGVGGGLVRTPPYQAQVVAGTYQLELVADTRDGDLATIRYVWMIRGPEIGTM